MEDLFDDFFGDLSNRHFFPVTGPFCDWRIRDDDKAFVLSVDLPDLDPEEFEVQLKGDVLTLKVHREEILAPESITKPMRKEAHLTSVRSIRLPRRVRRDEIEAQYKDGVLEIIIPKAERTCVKVKVKECSNIMET
jgi:HSP20 family protein